MTSILCKLRHDKPSIVIKVRDSSKKTTEHLCLLCYYFCAADKEFQNDFAKQSLIKTAAHEKEPISSTLQNCTCNKPAHKELVPRAMKFIETVSNRSRDLKVMRRQKKLHNISEDEEEQMKSIYSLVESWEIALVNEIFGCKETTPEGEKYLYELYPPHLDFFRRLNNTQAQLESKTFKWAPIPGEDINKQSEFLENIGSWSGIRSPREDLSPLTNRITLKYINLICGYTVKIVGKDTRYDQSQNFYTKLLRFYKQAYIQKRLSRVEPMEILGLERMTPLSRIELREINRAQFERQFPGSGSSPVRSQGNLPQGGAFNPAEFCKKCIDEFIIDFSFGSVNLTYRADLYAVQIATLLFRYGVLDLNTARTINELLYEKIQNLKSQEEALINEYKSESKKGFPEKSKQKLLISRAECLVKIRQGLAQILFYTMFHKQDESIRQIFKDRRMDDEEEDKDSDTKKINEAFFDEMTAKKLVEVVFGYFLESRKIGRLEFISTKVMRISKNFLFIFAKANDAYLTGLNLIRDKELGKYLSSDNQLDQTAPHAVRIRIETFFFEYYSSKQLLFDRGRLNQQLTDILSSLRELLEVQTINQRSLKSHLSNVNNPNQKVEQSGRKRIVEEQDDAGDDGMIDNTPEQQYVVDARDYKFRRYKRQRQIYRENIVFDLIMILNDFHDLLEKEVVKRFLEVLKMIFKSNTTLLSVLLNERTLTVLLEKAKQSPDLFVDFICKLFDGDWLCQTDSKIITKILDFYHNECNRYAKSQDRSSESNLVNILDFLRNWESSEKKAKIFHTFLSTDNMEILEALLQDLYLLLPKKPQQLASILDSRTDPERELMVALLKRIAALVEGNFTKDVFLMCREKFPLSYLEQAVCNVHLNMPAKGSLCLIFENLYINWNENLIGDRNLSDPIKPKSKRQVEQPNNSELPDFRQSNYIEADYSSILRILQRLLTECIEKDLSLVTDPVFEKRFFFECLLTAILRLVKSILMLAANETKPLRPYMIDLRVLMNKLAGAEHKINDLIGYCRRQQLNLMNLVHQLGEKLQKLDTDTAMARQPSMVSNVIKKMCIAWMKGEQVERSKYYIDPKEVNDFKLKLISNEKSIRQTTLKKLEKKLDDTKKSESTFLFTLRLTYLKEKIVKLTQHKENPYLNFLSEIQVKSNINDQELSDQQRIFTNMSKFILNNLLELKRQPRQRNQTYIFIEFVCNIFYFATKPAQAQLMRVWQQQREEWYDSHKEGEGSMVKSIHDKSPHKEQDGQLDLHPPNFLEDLWEEIINTWNYVTKKVNLNSAWCDQATKFMMLLKFCQYLAEDNCQPWKRVLGCTEIRGRPLIELLYLMEQGMIEQNEWNQRNQKFHLDELTFRNKVYLFDVLFAIQDLKTQLIIGPNYQNVSILYNKSYRNVREVMKRYTKDSTSPLSELKLNIMEYLTTMIECGVKGLVDQHLRNFSLDSLETLYVNYTKQAYYSVRYPERYQQLTSVKKIPLSMKDFKDMKATFIRTSEFSSHPLLKAACKIYAYINTLAFEKPMVDIFVKDRETSVRRYGNRKATLDEQIVCCWKLLSEITIGIEVVRRFTPDEISHRETQGRSGEPELMLYYFKVAGDSIYLSQQSKTQFENTVDRNNGETKVQELFETFEVFEVEIQHNKKKFKNKQKLFKLVENIYYCEIVSYFLTVLLNCMYLADFQSGGLEGMSSAVLVIGIAHIVWNVAVYILYAVFRLPLDYQINEFNLKRRERVKRLKLKQKFSIGLETVFLSGSFPLLLYVVFVVLAMAIKPWFISFNLLLIVNLNETMGYVLKSVTRYRGQLCMTYVFGLIIVYFFSLLNYTLFADKYQVAPADPTQPGPLSSNQIIGNTDPNEAFCSGLLPCYLNVVNSAIRSGNGIVALQNTQSFTSDRFVGTWFNAIFFFYLINIFMLNVIFGIIISTFGTLRDEQTLKQNDKQNICFMCHLERSEFEKYKRSFQLHQLEHDKWNYILFMHMMNKKTYKDCNALENYLKDRIQKKSIDWMPLSRSKSLEYAKKEIIQVKKDEQESANIIDEDIEKDIQDELSLVLQEMQRMVKGKSKEW